jgi:2,3-bisphosphoglycerate-independent phosphoglycerate mutase
MILDGWGVNPRTEGNAVALAETPNLDKLGKEYPATRLLCSGEAVGLPEGVMGNSEVGHLNIGAGRKVLQDLLRIDNAIQDRLFFKNQVFDDVMSRVLENRTALHLMGLVSDGGVHSQFNHITALIDMAAEKGLENIFIHAILDGRDTPPESGADYVVRLRDYIGLKGVGRIASVCGRYYAMDRDKRWERVEKAYRLYVHGEGRGAEEPEAAILSAYARGETDEFVKPVAMMDGDNHPVAKVRNGDGMIFFNFRADRAREITSALTDPEFDGFKRDTLPRLCGYVCMTLFDERFTLPVAFPPMHLKGILGEVISEQGLRQLRIAETEKYAHVTYFFNGGEEAPFPQEDRCLIPSPRDVATYDQKPEMSAFAVTNEVIHRVRSENYAVIVLNFANMDMVGHTGVLDAAIKACETVDKCVGMIVPEVLKRRGALLITADHGNSEKMFDNEHQPHTAHTTNPVPFILVGDRYKNRNLREGVLGDIAPTLLDIMAIEPPDPMTGKSLLKEKRR